MGHKIVHLATKNGARECYHTDAKRGNYPMHRGEKQFLAYPKDMKCPTCMNIWRERNGIKTRNVAGTKNATSEEIEKNDIEIKENNQKLMKGLEKLCLFYLPKTTGNWSSYEP